MFMQRVDGYRLAAPAWPSPTARPGEARDELEAALAIAKETGEQWFAPELHRLMGEWVAHHRPSAHAEAQTHLQRAIALAQEQNAKMWELRATTSLSRLWCEQGRHAEARAALAAVFAWFTEGLDLPDLRTARALLDELQRALPSRHLEAEPRGAAAQGRRVMMH